MYTFSELLDYINNLHQTKRSFTKEDFYEIGLKHKNLPAHEKSWNRLVDVIGYPGTADAYRHFVSYRQKKEDQFIDDNETDSEMSFDRLQYEALYKAQVGVRDAWNDYRADLRKEARIDRFFDLLESKLAAWRPLDTIKYAAPEITECEPCEAILPFGDMHLGNEFSNFLNSYNTEIAVKRVNTLIEGVVEECRINNVQVLHVLNIGDLISGLIHQTLRLAQCEDVSNQVIFAADIVSQMLNNLQYAAPKITYRSVIDNHARMNADKALNLNSENFNRIIDHIISLRLQVANAKVEFPDDNLDIGLGHFKLNNGKNVFFSHGHCERKTSVVQDMMGMTHEFPDYIIMGHYHNAAIHTFQGAKVFIIGSIIGTDTYAFDKRLVGYPEQDLLLFQNNRIKHVGIDLR